MAYLEAASVAAFERLGRELAALGAPKALCRAAVRALHDEKRHARVVRELAERAGGEVPPVRVPRGRARSLEAMATENAVEGCVYETFGAAVALTQSIQARDGEVRAAMSRIAVDEARHAELTWQVARWAEPRLTPAARARVERRRRRAARELVLSAGRSDSPTVVRELGMLGPAQARGVALDLAKALSTRFIGSTA